MATPDTAMVHSSRQVDPIQPKISISVTLSPKLRDGRERALRAPA